MVLIDGVSPAYLIRHEPPATPPATPPVSGNPTTSPPTQGNGAGTHDWSTAPNGETTHQVTAGESLWSLSMVYYGTANEQTYEAIAAANPRRFSASVPLDQQELNEGDTLEILSPERLQQIRKVQSDFATVKSDEASLASSKQQLAAARGVGQRQLYKLDIQDQQDALAEAQSQLDTDLQPLLQPAEPTQLYGHNVGAAQAADLKSILTEPELQKYIDNAQQTLLLNLQPYFGKVGDPNSLGSEIQIGDWTAAEHTEERGIAAAGEGIADPAQKQAAMLAFAQNLINMGPATAQYQSGISQAFDKVVVQPLVAKLNDAYAHPERYRAADGTYQSRTNEFTSQFAATMSAANPQVRVMLMSDLLAEKNSPLLAAAADIRAASNDSLGSQSDRDFEQTGRRIAAYTPLGLPAGDIASTPAFQIHLHSELDQAYRQLASACDLAAVGDTVGTGDPTGMIDRVAQAVLGDPNSSNTANLKVLSPSISNATGDGNINLTTEIASQLASAGRTDQATALLGDAAQGVDKLQAKINSDLNALSQLPTDVGIPVQSATAVLSDPQSAANVLQQYLSAHPNLKQEVLDKLKTDLEALDQDGQAVVRLSYAVQNMSADPLQLPGAAALTNKADALINDQHALTAVAMSPAANGEISFRQQQELFANAIQTGQDVNLGGRGFQYFPPGFLWLGRDLTAYRGAVAAQGPYAPFNLLSSLGRPGLSLDMTGTIAQQINNLAIATQGSAAPLNIDGVQARIAQINDRSLIMRFGGARSAQNPDSAAQIKSLQSAVAADPNNQTLETLNRQLAVSSDPQQRLQIMQQIVDVKSKSVMAQLDGMERAATVAGDTALVQKIQGLRTNYQAAAQRMQQRNEFSVRFQVPPTPANVAAWVNQAGKGLGTDLNNPDFATSPQGAALDKSLEALSSDDRAALLAGRFSGPLSALPPEVVDALQQYTIASPKLGLGAGPKGGLLPTTSAGGLGFSALKTAQMWGGAAYLWLLGPQPNGAINYSFSAGLAAFSVVPSTAEFASGVLQRLGVGGDSTLFTRGIGGSFWTAWGSVASWMWQVPMAWWAIEEFPTNPLQGSVVTAMSLSYLLPELFAESSWAGPASAAVDILGTMFVLWDNIHRTDQAIHQYDGNIQELLTRAGVDPQVAAALAQPDSQGVAAVVRLGQVFDTLLYYNTSNKQLNDQRRLDYLNNLSPQQASLLSQGLLNIEFNGKGQIPKTGAMDLNIGPPSVPPMGPYSLTPAEIQQYYNDAYTSRGLKPPQDPASVGIPPDRYLDYYEIYTASMANFGGPPIGGSIWSDLRAAQTGSDLPTFPTSIQGVGYLADLIGAPLQGALS